MKLDIPIFKIVEGDKEIKSFESYAELYDWCKKNNDEITLSRIMGDASLVMFFGEVPLKFDRISKELFELSWHTFKH